MRDSEHRAKKDRIRDLSQRVMFIIFDTNVWVSQLALNSPSGAAVRFFVQQQGATVVIPEVVRLELERHLTRRLHDLRESISSNHRQLLTVFGNLKEVALPTDDQIREKINEISSQLDVPTKDIPFSLKAAKSSFLKTINKVPPSDKTQEFKDGVIWAHCIDLLAEADVYLVTGDKAFFEGRAYSGGLAKNLKDEAAASKHEIKAISSLDELLDDIRKDVQIDEKKLVEAFLQPHKESVNRMLDRAGFALDGAPQVNVKLYATEVATQLYVEFEITFQCLDATDQGRTDAMIRLPGDGSYDTSTGKYLELRNQGEKLEYTDAEGQQKRENVVVMVGSVVIGHRSVQHTVRYPLS